MLQTLAHTCSHLQNASKARLGLTSIPSTNMNLALALALQHAGFVSSVTRGGPDPPPLLTPTSMPHASSAEGAAEAQLTQENVASRRLWLGLKYWRQEPVLSELRVESRPKKSVMLGWQELAKVCRGQLGIKRTQGRATGFVHGMRRPGECVFVSTDRGVMEAREAVEKKLGGMVLCRAS